MDLKKIKDLKVLLDAGTLSQTEFADLKLKIINGEDVNLDNYNQEQGDSNKTNSGINSTQKVGVKYSKEVFDKFTNKKTLTWSDILNKEGGGHYIGAWSKIGNNNYQLGDTGEPMFQKGKYGLRYIKTPEFTSIVIDYDFYGKDWLFIRNGQLQINLDDVDNVVLEPTESNTEVSYLGIAGWVSEVGYYNITEEELKKITYAKKIEVRFTSGKGSGDVTGPGLIRFEFMVKSMYQDITGDKHNFDWLKSMEPDKSKSESGCFVATAAMGSYDHPLVLDLRYFRDNWLIERSWGESFITNYYSYSPKYASIIDKNKFLKLLSYIFIVKPLHLISKLLDENK